MKTSNSTDPAATPEPPRPAPTPPVSSTETAADEHETWLMQAKEKAHQETLRMLRFTTAHLPAQRIFKIFK